MTNTPIQNQITQTIDSAVQ